MKIDLQVHSTYSDGYYSPSKLALLLHRYGIEVASLTDHNSIAGQKEFNKACSRYGIKTVPGIEIYTSYKQRTFNLLWYNYNPEAPEFLKMLESTHIRRRRFVKKITLRLRHLGLRFNLGEFIKKHPGYLPTNYLAEAIWEIPSNRSKIKKALNLDAVREDDIIRYCLYPKEGLRLHDARIGLTRILQMRQQIGGQLIICHPALNNKMHGNLVEHLMAAGVDGFELLSPHHSYNDTMRLLPLAERTGAIVSGGTDFHRPASAEGKLRYAWEWFTIRTENLSGVSRIINNKKKIK
ncbi:MAG: PHP domain-containing protein [Patescibacteria group bacterium]|nr:PHP domain-containing protein [Patescibacteria group bacterium]